jgi:hypothetical protein
MGFYNRFDAPLRFEDREFGMLFGIEDARGKEKPVNGVEDVLHLEHHAPGHAGSTATSESMR